jgi:cytoskeletal protein CcmA (bactofilin family)
MDARAQIGPSIVIKGQVTAQEDLVVAGRIEGTVQIDGHVVTVMAGGHVAADIDAKTIVVAGTASGKLSAADRIEIQDGANLEGHLAAPRIRMSEGAIFNGKIEMPAGAKKPLALAS